MVGVKHVWIMATTGTVQRHGTIPFSPRSYSGEVYETVNVYTTGVQKAITPNLLFVRTKPTICYFTKELAHIGVVATLTHGDVGIVVSGIYQEKMG